MESAPATWIEISYTTCGETCDAVRGGEVADLQRLAEAVGAADVGHQVARGLLLDQVAELVAGVMVLAGGHRDADRLRDFGARGVVVGELTGSSYQTRSRSSSSARLADVAERRRASGSRRPSWRRPGRAPSSPSRRAARFTARVGVVDLHLVVAAALAGVALGLGDEVLLGVLAPAAAAVAGDRGR